MHTQLLPMQLDRQKLTLLTLHLKSQRKPTPPMRRCLLDQLTTLKFPPCQKSEVFRRTQLMTRSKNPLTKPLQWQRSVSLKAALLHPRKNHLVLSFSSTESKHPKSSRSPKKRLTMTTRFGYCFIDIKTEPSVNRIFTMLAVTTAARFVVKMTRTKRTTTELLRKMRLLHGRSLTSRTTTLVTKTPRPISMTAAEKEVKSLATSTSNSSSRLRVSIFITKDNFCHSVNTNCEF